jgi:4-amino-4-deoxy-L-arabinose transferase-like glycosyltransferase
MTKRLPLILFIFIIILAAFLRLYQISSYMEFLGDEGRDVLVAKDILSGHLTLLGPRSSAGDFYMGPFYYYLITPFLLLSNYDPVGPAIMVALFGVATVFLIYLVGKKFFGPVAGLFAAALYAVSPLVLAYSHSSWNPDILPFFSLLLIFVVYKAVAERRSWKYFLLIGILLGICLQLHYLSLFLAVIIFTYIFLMQWLTNKKIMIVPLFKNYLEIIFGSIISLSPFILFEFRHDFLNTRGILKFILGDTVVQSYSVQTNFFTTVSQVFFRIWSRLILDFPAPDKAVHFTSVQLEIWGGAALIIAIASIIVLFKQKNKFVSLLLGLWLFLGVLLFGLYKKEIYDYLFTFIFPLPFLLVGNLLAFIYHFDKRRVFYVFLSLILFSSIFVIDLLDTPFRYEPNNQRDQAKKIVQFAISKTNNQPFNFALLSGGNADFAYRYYFEILGRKPILLENLEKDPRRKSATSQLLIVCEDIHCNPIGNPLHDVAAFGRAEIVGVWDVSVVKVYKLVPYKGK